MEMFLEKKRISEDDECSLTLHYVFTKLNLGKFLVKKMVEYNFIITGGYVRDVCILKLDKFNDIDAYCPKITNFHRFIDHLCSLGFMVKAWDIKKLGYSCTSNIITSVKTVTIIGIHSVIFPLETIVSIDIIFCDFSTASEWKKEGDCDFTCNLFIITSRGLDIRYNANFLTQEEKDFPFTYYYNLANKKQFYLSTRYITNWSILNKLKDRAIKLIKEGWTMIHNPRAMFTINSKEINSKECSICLSDSIKGLVFSTKCSHTYCVKCITKLIKIKGTVRCPYCRKSLIVDPVELKNKNTQLMEIDNSLRFISL